MTPSWPTTFAVALGAALIFALLFSVFQAAA